MLIGVLAIYRLKQSGNVDFLPKMKENRWDKSVETKIFDDWQRKKLFLFDKKKKKPVFAIDTPPPYVNTPVHIGHAYTYVIMDAIARYRRMMGDNVLFPIGLDKNGLPIEVQAEKTFGISMTTTPRDEFIKKCRELIEKSGNASLDSFKKLGLSCNSWKKSYELGGQYDTDDKEYRRMTQETFIDLWNKGLIYEDVKPTNYCPVCRTTISDAEVEYREDSTDLNYLRFQVLETASLMGEVITIATTRPELLCACKVILYNPEDQRYSHLEGRTAVVPLFGLEVPIMPHPYAKMDFGTGLVMICSFGDYSDVRILREMDLNPIYAIDDEGRMTVAAKKYRGMKVKEARAAVIEDLKTEGILEKQERIPQRQPICWRSKNPIEFVPMKELYLKQIECKDDLMKMADSMSFFAPESKQILSDWINSVNIDWVISRRRYYGTEIPLWHCKNCKEAVAPKPGKYYQPWKQNSPVKKCPKCGGRKFVGETRTFDTWFDSSSSEYYILGYLWDKNFWKKNMPCSLRPQGKEIVRTWLYFTMLKSWLLDKQQAFKNCWIHMHVVDENGQKMSKSAGNGVDPQEIVKKYGADVFRIWACLEGDITKGDIRCSFERIEGTSKFLTKFWNICRFISMFPIADKKEVVLEASDKWILAELSELVSTVKEKYDNYDFNSGAIAIRDFAWNVFAANYIEMVKARAYDVPGRPKDAAKSTKAAWYTLHEVMKTITILLNPIIPFVSEHVWESMYSKSKKDSINNEPFPQIQKALKAERDLLEAGRKVMEFNSTVWNTKKEKGMSLKDPIDIDVPKELKSFEKDLKLMHKIGMKVEPAKPDSEKNLANPAKGKQKSKPKKKA